MFIAEFKQELSPFCFTQYIVITINLRTSSKTPNGFRTHYKLRNPLKVMKSFTQSQLVVSVFYLLNALTVKINMCNCNV